MTRKSYVKDIWFSAVFVLCMVLCQIATKPLMAQDKFSVTRHATQVDGKTLSYTATTGLIQLKDDAGMSKADIFFVAYAKDNEDKLRRPITFAFNGGPGASSIFLHLGALGPKRALLGDEKAPSPPYRLATNEYILFCSKVHREPYGPGSKFME